MRISIRDLRQLVRNTLTEAHDDEGHTPFPSKGGIATLIRPVRVTPVAHGEWSDMESRGAAGWEGGEDSPLSRRSARPRGITATILQPGTRTRVIAAGKSEAYVTPLDESGDPIVDEQTGMELQRVKVHINKFCDHCAKKYREGKPKAQSSSQEERELKARIDKIKAAKRLAALKAELEALEAEEGTDGDPWGDKTDPDQVR